MRRLAKLSPAELSPDQRRLYAAITGGPRASGRRPFPLTDSDGGLEGPFNAMLLQPAVGSALQALGAAIRYQGTLAPRTREFAVLIVAAHWDSDFEQYAHEAVGRAAGLTEDELARIRAGAELELTDAAERAAVRACRALVRDGDLDDDEYQAAVGVLGAAGLFELTTLVGYYITLAIQLRAFRVGAPPP
jgi:4-carboxymuconolactone decarboxylase